MNDPHWSKVTYKDSNYQRGIETHSAAWDLRENYTAIKQSTYFYADIYGTQGEGCVMAVEVLYEGMGTTGSVATCPAWK